MIYRKGIPVEALATMKQVSMELGSDTGGMLSVSKCRNKDKFPKPVAVFGRSVLYVREELEAYYQQSVWNRTDRYIKEATGELDDMLAS
jgi:hypothetical protein